MVKAKAEFDETIDKMLAAAKRFDAGKVKVDQLARTGGAPYTRPVAISIPNTTARPIDAHDRMIVTRDA